MTQSWRLTAVGNGQDFHAGLPGLAVDDGLVGLEEGGGMVLVGEFDARGEEAAALLRGKLPVIRVVFPGAPLTGELLQLEIGPKGRLFMPTLSARSFICDIWRIPHNQSS